MINRIVLTGIVVLLFSCLGAQVPEKGTDAHKPPAWMRQAIVYGIKPSSFTEQRSFRSITRKLPEIRTLGVNTIWLQPVFKTAHGGQGYDVIDYFSVREDLGTAAELRALIDTAHGLGMRVLFDMVPNHTAIEHPFAADIIANGGLSPYYDYYQHTKDEAPYSQFYQTNDSGFVFYFWKNLVNLNYHHDEVKKMMTAACRYWVEEFNIDGYRFDACWGVRARNPEFFPALRKELKALKRDILLLAEDKGADEAVYENGFDAAYDWTSDSSWVSQWSWEYEYDERETKTMFNHPDEQKRIELMRKALFNNPANAWRVLRFMENNDLPRFLRSHSPQQTRMAAALLFALPGIPLLFGGQEAGVSVHPYSPKPIFSDSLSIQQVDTAGWFSYYQELIAERKRLPALSSATIEELTVEGKGCIAFRRLQDKQEIVVVVNPTNFPSAIRIKKTGQRTLRKGWQLTVPAFTTQWLMLKKGSLLKIKSS